MWFSRVRANFEGCVAVGTCIAGRAWHISIWHLCTYSFVSLCLCFIHLHTVAVHRFESKQFLLCGINSSLTLLLGYEGKSRQSSAYTRDLGKPVYVLALLNLLYIFVFYMCALGARGSVVGWGTILQARRSRVCFPMRSLDFAIDLIHPLALWLWSQLSL
jgi:hypothetical protein